MTAKSFETAQGLSDYQAEREVQEALCAQQMTPSERFAWLEANWGRLQKRHPLRPRVARRPQRSQLQLEISLFRGDTLRGLRL